MRKQLFFSILLIVLLINSISIQAQTENKLLPYTKVIKTDGIWDAAFKATGNKPVAISLKDNVFGKENYIGNHMRNVAPGQTMYDAYNALIFLAPLESLRRTVLVDYIYTDEYKKELERRGKLVYSEEEIKQASAAYGVKSLGEMVDIMTAPEPEMLLPQAKSIGAIDAWKDRK